jgi:glutathione S-transferase
MNGGHAALEAMERGLDGREFFVAGRYTIADIALYAYTHMAADSGFEMARFPLVCGWLERVAAQPGHIAITA